MKNKKLFISLFSCVLALSSGFIASTTVGAGTNDLTISTLSGEMVDGDDLFSDDNICIVDIIEEDEEEKLNLKKGIEVYEIDGPFFFGIANKFDECMKILGVCVRQKSNSVLL